MKRTADRPTTAADDIDPEVTFQRADVMFSMLRDRMEPEQAEQFAKGIYEPMLEGMYAMAEARQPDSEALRLLRRTVGSHESHESAYWSGCDACHALTESRRYLAALPPSTPPALDVVRLAAAIDASWSELLAPLGGQANGLRRSAERLAAEYARLVSQPGEEGA